MSNHKLEIACFNIESAMIAEQAGADRIEFCANMEVGGTTPLLTDFMELKSKISIPIYVMIRPRGGDFVYTEEEFEEMQQSVLDFKNAGANGFVLGVLNKNNEIDLSRNKQLIQLLDGLPSTFHKAFDEVENPMIALLQLIDLGFENVLTSGKKPTAKQGLDLLKQLAILATNKINIMVGGAVRSSNITELMNEISTQWFHSSAILQGITADFDEVRKLKSMLN